MAIAHTHNLHRPITRQQRPFGIRISLRENDPFRVILGPEWQKYHWFATATERDQALDEMSRKHEYSRSGDRPALVFVKVEKLAESRSL
ncbi:MAG TPA: hypothetical protein VEZ88_03875 [Steroidobacteraceae bacterium]|nr:hypothetical protein [Steroidobacteraceae bacterium]